MKFSEAMKRIENNYPVCRKGWNGKGMCVGKSRITSLSNTQSIEIVAIRAVDGVEYPWQPSQQDMLADDWVPYVGPTLGN